MMKTLDEYIQYCEEVAKRKQQEGFFRNTRANAPTVEGSKCYECAAHYRQLAELLKELKYYKDRQDLINKSWQELINYKEGIEKIKMRSQAYRERGENILASGMEQALDILEEVNADV